MYDFEKFDSIIAKVGQRSCVYRIYRQRAATLNDSYVSKLIADLQGNDSSIFIDCTLQLMYIDIVYVDTVTISCLVKLSYCEFMHYISL